MSNVSGFVPGDVVSVFSKRAPRPAKVLAEHNNQVLIEYRFPGGTTALLCFDLTGDELTWWGRNRQYKTLSIAWLQAIRDAGTLWAGVPQQRSLFQGPVPTATLLLQQRTFRLFWRTGIGPRFLARIRRSGWKEVSSWSSGGSGIAAQAILSWIRSSSSPRHDRPTFQASLLALTTRQYEMRHVFVSVAINGREWCIDAEGVKTREALLKRWEHLPNLEIVPFPDERGTVREGTVPFDADLSQEIAATLTEQVGPFSLGLLFPTYRRSRRRKKGEGNGKLGRAA